MIMKKLILTATLLVTYLVGESQQDPIYAQYLNNPVLLNPAYTGINNKLNAVVGYRKQWAGFDGNPTMINFSSHMSLYQNKVGAGLMVIQDKIGDTRSTEINAMYSYKLEFRDYVLSFGLLTGMVSLQNDPNQVNPLDQNDPSFTFTKESKFNFGSGLMLKSERVLLGLSVPHLIPSTVGQGGQQMNVYARHLYLLGAYVVYLSEYVRLKPSVLLRATEGSPMSADLNFNLNLEQRYTLGVFTRNFNTYGALVQMNIKDYRLGYVFELPSNNSLGANFTTHEISLSISLGPLSYHDRAFSNF